MPNGEKKGITVRIDADLHAEVSQYLRDHSMTMAEFVSLALDDELHPKNQMKEGNTMKYDEFKKAVDRIIEDEDTLMIHVSPDFQCDQTLGFPTSLCVCWEQGKAWLAPNDFMMSDLPDDQAQDVLNACAEYGIRNCEDAEDFNNLLRGLGQDAMDNAWLPDDEEGMVMS